MDGGLPNLLAVFGTRWNTTTNPYSPNSAATIFQGTDRSGEVALTSDNGTFDGVNLLFANIGIQSMDPAPINGSNNCYFDVGQTAPATPCTAPGQIARG